MAPSAQAHRRSHSLLLLQKLLNLRDSASPLTLVLDTLEQTASPIVQEFMLRAKISHAKVIFIAYTTLKKPSLADVVVKARGKSLQKLRAEIVSYCPPPAVSKDTSPSSQKTLLIIDTLNPLAASSPHHLPTFLSSLLAHPSISLVATYHSDIPLSTPAPTYPQPSQPSFTLQNEYEPSPITLLTHLATAILRVSNLHHALVRRRAQNRSLPEPDFGLDEGREGVLVGLCEGSNVSAPGAVVLEMELRRRSGRAVVERFVVTPRFSTSTSTTTATSTPSVSTTAELALLADHPLFALPDLDQDGAGGSGGGGAVDDDEQLVDTTFNLGLTEKQRRDREGIVLPYFDAQQDVGGGEGGRILYDMGREDDFDDEEDEI
ncbi:Elongator complex protein 5 [Coniella lustricola]|uniref:Elongator complex protein 5 n=1 Tax=Coniella lustricola TaxID=2025994 RepID=A0A2T3AJU4_9PEZI|nr:Elongator complex protein 5 [Coniella lustricola]